MEAAGKLEKEHLNLAVPPKYPIDLPPAYEDVANLHVAIPAAQPAQAAPSGDEKSKQEEPVKT